jgi:hypothetical protein
VTSAIRTVFARFAELGSVRRVWLWLRSELARCPDTLLAPVNFLKKGVASKNCHNL